MREPMMPMPKLPNGCGLMELECTMIHGAPYYVIMDGLDSYIYELADGGKTMKLLVKLAGWETTERLAIALLRAASLQRGPLSAGERPK